MERRETNAAIFFMGKIVSPKNYPSNEKNERHKMVAEMP
jgi:hypothetical protein